MHRYFTWQIIFSYSHILLILKQIDIGMPVSVLCCDHVADNYTFYMWNSKHDDMDLLFKRLMKEFEDETMQEAMAKSGKGFLASCASK